MTSRVTVYTFNEDGLCSYCGDGSRVTKVSVFTVTCNKVARKKISIAIDQCGCQSPGIVDSCQLIHTFKITDDWFENFESYLPSAVPVNDVVMAIIRHLLSRR
jgi:hypothetical protein